MNNYRRTSITVGTLYILGTVFGILAAAVAGGVAPPNELDSIASDPSPMILGTFFIVMMGLSLSAMAVFLYPVFRKEDEALALGMVVFRGALEGSGYLLAALTWLFLIALGEAFAAPAVDETSLQALADAVIGVNVRFFSIIHTLVFIIGAAMLYVLFYRTRLIPRWLSLWGLIGAIPYLMVYLLKFFGIDPGLDILVVPLAVQEMVMALWLIIQGFNTVAVRELDDPVHEPHTLVAPQGSRA